MNENEDEPSSSSIEPSAPAAPSSLEEDHDMKLIQFQDITHLDDLDECRAILESTGWDLDVAVQSYFSGSQVLTPEIPIEASANTRPPIGFSFEPSMSSFTGGITGTGRALKTRT